MYNIDIVHERMYQARACIAAINIVLLDRENSPENDTMSDNVLQGLAAAAGALLDQADAAAEGYGHVRASLKAVSHG